MHETNLICLADGVNTREMAVMLGMKRPTPKIMGNHMDLSEYGQTLKAGRKIYPRNKKYP
jgi:hypothetical protein